VAQQPSDASFAVPSRAASTQRRRRGPNDAGVASPEKVSIAAQDAKHIQQV